jgi:hypothetical protein
LNKLLERPIRPIEIFNGRLLFMIHRENVRNKQKKQKPDELIEKPIINSAERFLNISKKHPVSRHAIGPMKWARGGADNFSTTGTPVVPLLRKLQPTDAL